MYVSNKYIRQTIKLGKAKKRRRFESHPGMHGLVIESLFFPLSLIFTFERHLAI
jgi:hypothetical protein